jgi:hypothetical protein
MIIARRGSATSRLAAGHGAGTRSGRFESLPIGVPPSGLPEAVRAGIVAMVEAAVKGHGGP